MTFLSEIETWLLGSSGLLWFLLNRVGVGKVLPHGTECSYSALTTALSQKVLKIFFHNALLIHVPSAKVGD